MGKTYDWLVKKKDEGVGVGETVWAGLTDTTGDVVENAVDFGQDAKQDFKEYVTDPVMGEVENAQDWSHTTQADLKDGLEWAKYKAAEGYVEKTDFLFGEEGWFEDVTDPVQQAWAATENGNYLDASLYTGEAFLNAVDVVGTGGIGKMTYDWIMGSVNADDDAGPLYWEVLDEQHLMVAYENEETFFKFDNPDNMEKFILKLESESEGSGSPEWAEDDVGPEAKDYTDYDPQGTDDQGYAGGGDTAGETGKVANEYEYQGETKTHQGGR